MVSSYTTMQRMCILGRKMLMVHRIHIKYRTAEVFPEVGTESLPRCNGFLEIEVYDIR